MKKFIAISLAIAAFVGCSKEQTIETANKHIIGFDNAFVNNSTRAAEDITYDNIANFSVYGSVVKDNTSGMIFSNQKVEKSGDAFTYSPTQYWIAGAKYDFVAIAPNADAKWTYAPTATTAAQNGTISFNNSDAKASQDLLYAYTPKATDPTITSQPDKVGFTFGHLLSKVVFKFTNGFAEGSNISLEVYNVKISNTAANGSLEVSNGETADWSAVGSNNDLAVSFGPTAATEVNAIAANNGTLTTEYFYLIPVKRTYNITFNVDIYQAGVKIDTYEHSVDAEIDFGKGKSYSLNTTLTPSNVNPDQAIYPIEFNVEGVDGWTSATNPSIDQTIK